MRYRVSAVVKCTLQRVVQARNSEEAEACADAGDFENWSYLNSEYEIVAVAENYFLTKVKVEQDLELLLDLDGPTLKIVN